MPKTKESIEDYTMYDFIIMSPEDAGKVLLDECEKENPNIELIQNILEFAPVNVNLQNSIGSTALMWASDRGHTEIVRMLLGKILKYLKLLLRKQLRYLVLLAQEKRIVY